VECGEGEDVSMIRLVVMMIDKFVIYVCILGACYLFSLNIIIVIVITINIVNLDIIDNDFDYC